MAGRPTGGAGTERRARPGGVAAARGALARGRPERAAAGMKGRARGRAAAATRGGPGRWLVPWWRSSPALRQIASAGRVCRLRFPRPPPDGRVPPSTARPPSSLPPGGLPGFQTRSHLLALGWCLRVRTRGWGCPGEGRNEWIVIATPSKLAACPPHFPRSPK